MKTSAIHPLLFIFHPLSGTIFCYLEFARCLEKKFSVYGIQAVGLDGQRQPYSCLEAMAAHYAIQLQDVLEQAATPVTFAGFSFGGSLALETATHLLRMGIKISCVVLLDSHKVHTSSVCWRPTDIEMFSMFVETLEKFPDRKITIPPEQLLRVGHYQQSILLEKSLGPEFAGAISPLLRVYKSNIMALTQHTLKYYDGKVIYFLAAAKLGSKRDRSYPITEYIPKLIVEEIAVDHSNMLSEPCVSMIASRILETLIDNQ